MSAKGYTRIWLLCRGGKLSFASATQSGASLERDVGEYVVPIDVPSSVLREPAEARKERKDWEAKTGKLWEPR